MGNGKGCRDGGFANKPKCEDRCGQTFNPLVREIHNTVTMHNTVGKED